MRLLRRRRHTLAVALAFAGTVYLFLSIQFASGDGASAYANGLCGCGLLWLPALILLLVRVARQPPFAGEMI